MCNIVIIVAVKKKKVHCRKPSGAAILPAREFYTKPITCQTNSEISSKYIL
jgi:hypothetical protein